MSFNRVILIGNVGRDPVASAVGQAKMVKFTLATSEKFKDRNNEWREQTEWHNIVTWRQQADFVEKYVKKGSQVFIEGKITTRSWQDQTGAQHSATEIQASTVQLISSPRETAPAPAAAPPSMPPI